MLLCAMKRLELETDVTEGVQQVHADSSVFHRPSQRSKGSEQVEMNVSL